MYNGIKSILLISLLITFATKDSDAQSIPEYSSFESFEHLLNLDSDTLYIVNFWATWCQPCIKEMPYFQKIHDEYSHRKMRMILVNLDFGRDYKERVRSFIERHQLTPEVIILDDTDGNKWIPKVDPSWTGGIPATVIYGRDYRYFFQGMVSYDTLMEKVEKHLVND